MRKIILLSLLFIILILVGAGIYYWNKGPRDIAASEVDIYIDAEKFYQEYAADETASNTKYLNKVIAVKGMVSSLELENPEEPTVDLKADSADHTVRCGFKKELLPDVKKLKAGDQIKIKGKCDGIDLFGSPVITQCSLMP